MEIKRCIPTIILLIAVSCFPIDILGATTPNHNRKSINNKMIVSPRKKNGEYIVSFSKKVQIQKIKEVFKEYEIINCTVIYGAKNMYLIKISRDPGIEAMLKLKEKYKLIKSIQRNNSYKSF